MAPELQQLRRRLVALCAAAVLVSPAASLAAAPRRCASRAALAVSPRASHLRLSGGRPGGFAVALRAGSPEDGGLGEAIDTAAAALEQDRKGKKKVAKNPNRLISRVGWLSWWAQAILNVVAAVVLTFARATRVPPAAGPYDGPLFSGILFSAAGTLAGFLSLSWTWALNRLAKREPNSPAFIRKAKSSLKAGAVLNIIGMGLTLVSAQQVVGTLIAKSLLTPGVLGALASSGAGTMPSAAPVTAIDIFVVQANTNTLCSHLFSITSILFILLRAEKWDTVAPAAAKKEKKAAPA